jgi:hypothetical protein
MKWAIEIQETSLERRNLSDLVDGLGFKLVEGIQYPALTSPEVDACATAADAFEKAKAVRAAFKGAAQIDPELRLGSVIDYSTTPPKRHAFIEVDSCVIRTSVGNLTVSMSPPTGLSDAELDRWKADYEEQQYQTKLEQQRSRLEPAFRSARAAKVLELLSVDSPSAETLYKIYELAEGHPKNRSNFHQQFSISDAQLKRFGDAVHNPSVSGDWARHAYRDLPKTSNPMSQSEAETFVRNIVAKWLQTLR